VREIIPYKSGKRPSTFRKLNIDFAGTALEQALAQREQANLGDVFPTGESSDLLQVEPLERFSTDTPPHHSPPLPTTPQTFNSETVTSSQKQPLLPVTTSHHQSPPLPSNNPSLIETAPTRDFNRRANSLERDALPSGTFPGASKKVYDALYLRTRGSIKPTRLVQASRRELLEWTGIRNLKTIDNHIKYLMAVGLIIRHWELGSNEGSSYEVVLPEEKHPPQYPPVVDTGGELPPLPTPQKTSSGYTQKMGSGGEGQIIENTTTSRFPNTINTKIDDDTHTLSKFIENLTEAARSVVGGDFVKTEEERQRWGELGQLLADELRTAARRTGTVSSVPAFLTAHLRRCLRQKDDSRVNEVKESIVEKSKTLPQKKPGIECDSESTPKRENNDTAKSKFSIDECRRYAEHLKATGQGITNPGGYATKIHRTGEADASIQTFLKPVPPLKQVDISQCPDCKGTGYYYPKGIEHGVARCKHEALRELPEGDVVKT
jgi:hypothetical protein